MSLSLTNHTHTPFPFPLALSLQTCFIYRSQCVCSNPVRLNSVTNASEAINIAGTIRSETDTNHLTCPYSCSGSDDTDVVTITSSCARYIPKPLPPSNASATTAICTICSCARRWRCYTPAGSAGARTPRGAAAVPLRHRTEARRPALVRIVRAVVSRVRAGPPDSGGAGRRDRRWRRATALPSANRRLGCASRFWKRGWTSSQDSSVSGYASAVPAEDAQ